MIQNAVENINAPQVEVEIYEEYIPKEEPLDEQKDTFFIRPIEEVEVVEAYIENHCEECPEINEVEVQTEEVKEEQFEEQVEKSQIDNLSESIVLMKAQLNKMQEEMEKFKKPEDKTETKGKETHYYVTCDGCRMTPLMGKRYKCLVCPNFDLCEKCEIQMNHEHDMIVLKKNCNRQICRKVMNAYQSVERKCGQMGNIPVPLRGILELFSSPFERVQKEQNHHASKHLQKIEKLFKRKQRLDEKYNKTCNEEKKQKIEEKIEKMDIMEKLELINFILDKPESAESAKKREEFAKLHKGDTLE